MVKPSHCVYGAQFPFPFKPKRIVDMTQKGHKQRQENKYDAVSMKRQCNINLFQLSWNQSQTDLKMDGYFKKTLTWVL